MSKRTLAFLAAAAAVVIATYALRVDTAIGLVGDDAWYALLSRTLARGGGYQLANTPTPGVLPAFPPGFPLLLAPLWLLAPAFPANVLVLKSLSIGAMLAVGPLTYLVARRRLEPWLAAGVACATVLLPSLVFLATSTLMSECVFLAAQLATLVVFERWPSRAGTVTAGIGAALVVLIRTTGLALPAGILAYLAVRREWRRALLFAVVAGAALLPWQMYALRHQASAAQREAQGGAAWSYREQFWMQWAGAPGSGTITIRDLPRRVVTNAVDIVARDMAGLVAAPVLRGAGESGLETIAIGSYDHPGNLGNRPTDMALSTVLFGLMAIGWWRSARRRLSPVEFLVPLTFAAIAVWPYWSFRFVLPLAPFLLVYLGLGLEALAPAAPRLPALILSGTILLSVVDHAQYIARLHTNPPEWMIYASDIDSVLAWLEQHPAPGLIETTNPALVYLQTGAPTIQLEGLIERRTLKAKGVRYLVSVNMGGVPVPRDQGTVRFLSPRVAFWVVEL